MPERRPKRDDRPFEFFGLDELRILEAALRNQAEPKNAGLALNDRLELRRGRLLYEVEEEQKIRKL